MSHFMKLKKRVYRITLIIHSLLDIFINFISQRLKEKELKDNCAIDLNTQYISIDRAAIKSIMCDLKIKISKRTKYGIDKIVYNNYAL